MPGDKINIDEEGSVDIVNLKCEYVLISSLLGQKGFFPAYHMNKAHWITALLDESVEDAELKWLLQISRDLTAPKKKIRKSNKDPG